MCSPCLRAVSCLHLPDRIAFLRHFILVEIHIVRLGTHGFCNIKAFVTSGVGSFGQNLHAATPYHWLAKKGQHLCRVFHSTSSLHSTHETWCRSFRVRRKPSSSVYQRLCNPVLTSSKIWVCLQRASPKPSSGQLYPGTDPTHASCNAAASLISARLENICFLPHV